MAVIGLACRRVCKLQARLALLLCIAVTTSVSAGPSVFPTGVTRYDPSKAYNCDVLFAAPDHRTYLIDMNGNVLHRWDYGGFPAKMLDPALTGGVKGEIGVQTKLVPAGSKAGQIGLVPGHPGIFRDLTFGYVNWEGKTVWEWGMQAPGGAALQHHDWDLLPNGNTLLLVNKVGRLKRFGTRLMLQPLIYEVNKAGRIVWTWRATQHLRELGFTSSDLAVMKRIATADFLHFNDLELLGPNRWAESGDTRFAPGNILISSRDANFIAIISRKSGKIVWRVGPHFSLQETTEGPTLGHKAPFELDRFSGQHDAHMIPEGLPGAGDILLFDNEGEGGYPPVDIPLISGSRVLEFNPITLKVVWQYSGTKTTFFSPFISSAQRLPNGNTLIDEGIWGRFFQVTPEGKIVWEYISPFVGNGTGAGTMQVRWVYRIQAVPYSWVPKGGPHSEVPVHPPTLADFHISPGKN